MVCSHNVFIANPEASSMFTIHFDQTNRVIDVGLEVRFGIFVAKNVLSLFVKLLAGRN